MHVVFTTLQDELGLQQPIKSSEYVQVAPAVMHVKESRWEALSACYSCSVDVHWIWSASNVYINV